MKKIIALMLVMLLAFSVVGCKSKGYTDDEEIAVIAGDETQADIQENTGINEQEQKTEEKADTPQETVDESDKTTEASTESTDKDIDTSTESDGNTDNGIEKDQTTNENQTESLNKKDDINQIEYEKQKIQTCSGRAYDAFKFNCISDMVNTLKTHEYAVTEQDRKFMEEYAASLSEEKDRQDILSRFGTKNDVRYDDFKTDKINYFYKIKDFEGYTLSKIVLEEKNIIYTYSPIGKEKVTDENKISVYYLRPEEFLTDSYFDDYVEYYKNTTVTKDGFIYEDYYEKHGFATIIFPVENTIIEIFGNGDMANYEALKKLCVAEKVVVK